MAFTLTVLGSNSALPTATRYPTSHILNINERYLLIDCGEGTQMQLRKYRFKIQRINHIFISHLHGDHYFGLPGLIFSLSLLGRTKALHVYAPSMLQDMINIMFEVASAKPKYELLFHALPAESNKVIFEDAHLTVASFPLVHKIPCWGFLFKEKLKPRSIIKEKIDFYRIPVSEIPKIKSGEDYQTSDGKIIKNTKLTLPPPKQVSYSFCTDTRYDESIIPIIKGADVLYHESTFLKDMTVQAENNFHSTAEQAATIALKADVKQLIIGHYSARYKNLQPFLNEAKQVFGNTLLAEEGKQYLID